MKEIELFHYYRQDVLNARYDAGRFLRVQPDGSAMVYLNEIFDEAVWLKRSCRLCSVTEEERFLREGDRFFCEYRMVIRNGAGTVGFLLVMKIPLGRERSRAGPSGRWQQQKRFN